MFDGRILRQWRINRGYSVKDLAALAGCSQSAISDWESGRRTPNEKYRKVLLRLMYPTREA